MYKKTRQHDRHDIETAGNGQDPTIRLLPAGIYRDIMQGGVSCFLSVFMCSIKPTDTGNVLYNK